MWRRLLYLLAALPGVLLAACATVHPPADPAGPVTVYLADYGRHASLILPRRGGGWAEYAYGEWRWFALEDNWVIRAPPILLLPAPATLGRRELPVAPGAPGASIGAAAGAARTIAILVSSDSSERLVAALDERFSAASATLVHNRDYDMDFVRDPRRYWLPHNCNSQVADWLRALGCRVSRPVIFSGFRLGSPADR